MSARYDQVRRPEHSTLGDAAVRYERDEDAFAAGAQYALDHMHADFRIWSLGDAAHEWLDVVTSRILGSVHDGSL